MLVPFVTMAVLWIFFKHKTAWWEFGIPFIASLIFALLAKLIVNLGVCEDKEYWTGWVTKVNYFEDWKETVVYYEQEPDGYKTVRHSDGKTSRIRNYKRVRKTRTQYHPSYYQIEGSNGECFAITSKEYNDFKNRFNNETFKDLHRSYCCGDDGDMYYSIWPNTKETMEVITTIHSYTNKVANSKSVFNFQEINSKEKEEYQLFDYPSIKGWECPSILSRSPINPLAVDLLDKVNARLGAIKEIRIWILIFDNQSLEAGYKQEQFWKGGNKNELVICIGLKNSLIDWAHVFSWTEKEQLKTEIRNSISLKSGSQLDLVSLVNMTESLSAKLWQRKNFAEFNYISIDPPLWATLLCFFLTIGLNVGISFWLVKNEFNG